MKITSVDPRLATSLLLRKAERLLDEPSFLKNLQTPSANLLTSALIQVVGPVVEAVARNPQQAAEIARQTTEVGAALIKASSKYEDTGRDSVSEEITKREKKGNIVTTTTTTTTTTTRDLVRQAEYGEKVADQVEQFGAGLSKREIRLGKGEVITFNQITDLATAVTAFLKNPEEKESAPINIGEDTPKAENFTSNEDPLLKPEGPEPFPPPIREQDSNPVDLGAIAELAKKLIDPNVIASLKTFVSGLSTRDLGLLVKEILK